MLDNNMDETLHTEPVNSETKNEPVMDIVAPPKAAVEPVENIPEASPANKPVENHTTPKQPSQNHGIVAVIFATVVIVISLSILATYAYIKSK